MNVRQSIQHYLRRTLNGRSMDQLGTLCLLSAAAVCLGGMLTGSLLLWIIAAGLAMGGMAAHVLSPHVEARRLVRQARELARLGRLREALGCTNRAIALVPDVMSAFVVRSALYAGMGQLDMAVDDAEHAVRLAPRHAEARLARARMYSRYGLHEDAIHDLQIGLRERPDWAAGYLEVAHLYVRLQDYQNTLDTLHSLEKHVRATPSRYEALLLAGWVYEEKLQDLEQALSAYSRAIPLHPERRLGYARRAAVYTARGDWLQAAEDWLKAAHCIPAEDERGKAHWLRAACYGKRFALTRDQGDLQNWLNALQASAREDSEQYAKLARTMLRLLSNPHEFTFPPRVILYLN